jgi:hypothetical protein
MASCLLLVVDTKFVTGRFSFFVATACSYVLHCTSNSWVLTRCLREGQLGGPCVSYGRSAIVLICVCQACYYVIECKALNGNLVRIK